MRLKSCRGRLAGGAACRHAARGLASGGTEVPVLRTKAWKRGSAEVCHARKLGWDLPHCSLGRWNRGRDGEIVFDITALDRVMGGEADLTAVTSSFVDFGHPGGRSGCSECSCPVLEVIG